MAQNGVDPTYGWPRFPVGDAPEVGVDEEIVAAYARWRGNRIVDSTSARTAFTSAGYAYAGITWHDTDDDVTYIYDGSDWQVLWSDTGWVPITLAAAGAGGNIRYRQVGNLVEIRSFTSISATIGNGNTVIASGVPSAIRPTSGTVARGNVYFSGNYNGAVGLTSGGDLIITNQNGDRTGAQVALTYFLG